MLGSLIPHWNSVVFLGSRYFLCPDSFCRKFLFLHERLLFLNEFGTCTYPMLLRFSLMVANIWYSYCDPLSSLYSTAALLLFCPLNIYGAHAAVKIYFGKPFLVYTKYSSRHTILCAVGLPNWRYGDMYRVHPRHEKTAAHSSPDYVGFKHQPKFLSPCRISINGAKCEDTDYLVILITFSSRVHWLRLLIHSIHEYSRIYSSFWTMSEFALERKVEKRLSQWRFIIVL